MNNTVRDKLIVMAKMYKHDLNLALKASKYIMDAPKEDWPELLTTFMLYYKFDDKADLVPANVDGGNLVELRQNMREHIDEFNTLYNVSVLCQKLDEDDRSYMEIWSEKISNLSLGDATYMIVLACEDERFPVLTEPKPVLPHEYKQIRADVDKQNIYEVEHVFNQKMQTMSQMADALLQLMNNKSYDEKLVMLSHVLTIQILFND